jgi:hypothetical protein
MGRGARRGPKRSKTLAAGRSSVTLISR